VTMDSLPFAGAVETAALIKRGSVSATEVVQAYLARIASHNSRINALVTVDEEGALARAREADRSRARGMLWGPLHGVPVTLKDCH